MKTSFEYQESTLFAVPLEGGSYAIGLVARRSPKGKIIFAYFFDPGSQCIPNQISLQKITKESSILRLMCGDLQLHNGTWPIIGHLSPWKREEWPMPLFYREDLLGRERNYVVQYSDDDPAKVVAENLTACMPHHVLQDSLAGAEAVKVRLKEILLRK